MRGLDSEERHTLAAIMLRDFPACVKYEDALIRCMRRNLIQGVIQLCENCGTEHMLPVITAEGKTAMVCNEATRTLEL